MSASVRARRPPSPSPGLPHVTPSAQYPPISISRKNVLDADERREAAAKGYGPAGRKHPLGGLQISSGEWKLLVLVLILATFVRLFRISHPDSVVFDEVHFGKFTGRYIKTRYFVDVHPPLAKLLITAAAFLSGFDGDFDFEFIGKSYVNTPYIAMRMVPAALGVATIPIAYLTLRALDCKATTALLASLFLTFENGLVTQSRHILLDSPLVFFTALATFSFVGFSNENKRESFSERWWAWLLFTGLSLGAVLSCKWVGLFTVATVGVCTVLQLWLLLGDSRVKPRTWTRHFLARALCLIAIPILFYMTMFELHLMILENPGDGDAFMSSEFRQTLGNGLPDTYADVAYGSEVTIRHLNTQGGYLHSHPHNYPGGSKQQQITLYPHRDENNQWRILNVSTEGYSHETQPLQYISDGSRVKLRHVLTDKALHSHDIRPPVSDVDFQSEVSAYGMAGFAGDLNDDWVVVIVNGDKKDKESSKRVKTFHTHFQLRHLHRGCYLFSHKVKLPAWGFEQQEVTCNQNAAKANSMWFIESASKHPKFPENAQKVNYRTPGFLSKFWELQRVMWMTNAGLTDKHAYDSRPLSWPRLLRGINFWAKDGRQIYLVGNPFVWWTSTASVGVYILVRGFLIIRAKRGYRDFENTKVVKYDALCGFLFTGYFMHYIPFFLMSRQLFLHHYFPALYFAILLSCAVFDFATSALTPKIRLQIAAVFAIVAIWNFSKFSPLTYGTQWTSKDCTSARWVKTWDFTCSVAYLQDATYGKADDRAAIALDGGQSEVNTAMPTGIVAEPGKDVFAKDDADKAKTTTLGGLEQKDMVPSGGDKRLGSVAGEWSVEEGAGEPVEVEGQSATVAVHEEALADQVAHELYPEARDVAE